MTVARQLEYLAALQQRLQQADTERQLALGFVRGCHRLLLMNDSTDHLVGQTASRSTTLSIVVLFADTPNQTVANPPLGEGVRGLWFVDSKIRWLGEQAGELLASDVLAEGLVQLASTNVKPRETLITYLAEHLPSKGKCDLEVVYSAALELPIMPAKVSQQVKTRSVSAPDVTQQAVSGDVPVGLLAVIGHSPHDQSDDNSGSTSGATTSPKPLHLGDADQALLKVALAHMAHCLRVLRQARDRITADSLLAGNEAIPDCYLGIDHEGCIQHLNQRAADMLGRSKQQLYGRPLGDLLPHFRKALERALQYATSSDRPQCLDVQSPHDGSWQELHIQAVASGFQLYSRDISERKRVEAVLEQERGELHRLADFRHKLVEFVNRTLQIVPQDGWHQEFLQCVLDVIPNAQAGSMVMPDPTRDGRFYYVAAVGYELSELQIISFSEADMHARNQGHPTVVHSWERAYPAAFHEQREHVVDVVGSSTLMDQLAAIAASLCVPVYAVEANRTDATHAQARLDSTANAQPSQHLTAPSYDTSYASTQMAKQLKGMHTDTNHMTMAPTVNMAAQVDKPLVAMLFIDNFDYAHAFPADILELAQTVAAQMAVLLRRFALEHTIRQNERRYRYVTDVIAEVVYVYRQNEEGVFVREWGNWDNELRLTGYTPKEIDALGGWSGIIHPDDVHVHLLQKTRIRQGEGGVSEYRIITKLGEERWIRDFCKSVLDETGTVIIQYGANQDITEQKRAEHELEALLALTKQQRALAEAQLAELKELHAANHRVTADLRANEARYKRIAEENIQLLALEKEQRLSLEARIGELAILNNLNRVVSRATDLDGTLAVITEHVAYLFQSSHCHVALLRDFDNALEVVAEYVNHGTDLDINHDTDHDADSTNPKTKLGVVIDATEQTAAYKAIYQGQATVVQATVADDVTSDKVILDGVVSENAVLDEMGLENSTSENTSEMASAVDLLSQSTTQPASPLDASSPKAQQDISTSSLVNTLMIAPLRARDKVFGVISVEAEGVEQPFNQQELSLLETVAGNVAGLISNAKLYSLQKDQFDTLKKLKAQLERKNRELVYLSMRDPLTGLYNRRHFDRVLTQAFTTTQQRTREHLSVAVCDIDDFKQINDTFSHSIGDDVLRTVATLMLTCVRAVDTVARYGGEEFAILLPQTNLEDASAVCERIRKDIAHYPWHEIQDDLNVTVSIGICADTSVSNHEKMMNQADRNLYKAKHNGKNQVCY
ncbi:MAG: diguanylate cyclase [Deinococcota bacterium]